MKRIRSLAGLMKAARRRKAVTCPDSRFFRGPLPAGWVINLQGGTLHLLIKQGMYIYEAKKIRRPSWQNPQKQMERQT